MRLKLYINGAEQDDKYFPISVADEQYGQSSVTVPYSLSVVHGDAVEVRVDGDTVAEGSVFQINAHRKNGVKKIQCANETNVLYQKYCLDAGHYEYATEDAGLIAKGLVDHYFAGILTSTNINVTTGTTVSSIDVYGRSVGDALEDLAERAGCLFYVRDSDVHFFVEGTEDSKQTVSAADVFDVLRSTRGIVIKKVIVQGGCGIEGTAGSGYPEKYVYDRTVADNAEAAEVAAALLGIYQTARTKADIYTFGFWNLRAGQSLTVDLPADGYDSSAETVRRITWTFAAGNVQTVITVGDEDPDDAVAFAKIIRNLELKRNDANLTSSAHTNNHAGGGVDNHAGTNTDAHGGANTDAHAGTNTDAHGGTGVTAHAGTGVDAHAGTNTNSHSGGNVTAPTSHGHKMHEVPASGYSKDGVVYWDEDGGHLFYDAGGGSTPDILAGAEGSHTHSFVQPNNHSITQPNSHSVTNPNNHSVTQPNNHIVTQPNNHSITQPSAHASHTIC